MKNSFVKQGEILTAGHNVDRISIAAGLRLATAFGYDDEQSQMILSYALRRHARGEEAGAERTALSGGIDFCSWRAVLAAGMAGAQNDIIKGA